jgi:pimeloyl-[acyl-carrier protein] methyl ester esterase
VILLVHGWGYDAGFWDPLCAKIGASLALDLGFFGAPADAIPDGVTVLAGHSLGFLWLLRQPALAHLPLIGINAFPRFLESDDYAPAVPPRMLERMRRRLLAEPQRVLQDFWDRAGAAGPARTPDAAALGRGLGHLGEWDERANLVQRSGPVRLIAGGADAIVPPEMTRMAFPTAHLTWLPEGGHVLPRSHAAEIAAMVTA